MTAVPRQGTDCHTHLFGPADQFPFSPDRAYTPDDASEADASRMLARLGLDRIVLVHASVYDRNTRLLKGLDWFGDRARGVITISGEEAKADLHRLRDRGVSGVRINNISNKDLSARAVVDRVLDLSRKVADLGWHVQVFLSGDSLRGVLKKAGEMPSPLVVDHFGLVSSGRDEDQQVRDLLLDRVGEGACWLKLSAAYRLPGEADDARALTTAFIARNPDRLLWGSDWPHPPANRSPDTRLVAQPFRAVDTQRLFEDFLDAVPDTTVRQKILVDNPTALYRF